MQRRPQIFEAFRREVVLLYNKAFQQVNNYENNCVHGVQCKILEEGSNRQKYIYIYQKVEENALQLRNT